ncbi:transcriptional regulator with XRE-family HTH domain [Streptosporangium becharense]|uniref:Transcriptional regulator with XRE-family HTH domain n=1 Tax=Streptosporangium becharense TaxID=1816182 RepID=A0A7W9ILD9_9ACTN|nr:helix-turn-helix transcriptional regulator [Streptosporangium becharense]MBB2913280.1 transcriptional regulator with XRE-family HTH domain [Streptosporangium becharense]MBB5822263.1 transcriptional regulator with XRE-family HTH domain [Streptosporangium becharense]
MGNLYTPQSIWGRELRHYRKAAGLTQGQLAERIHFSESLISGVETGQLPASPEFAETCDRTLDTGGALGRLLDWRKGQIFPSWFGRWRDKEQEAIALRAYEPLVFPGLLQTKAYARVLLQGDETAVEARLDRQSILTREDPRPPTLRCVIDEAVLYRPIGDPEVMKEQLEHLTSVISPRLSVQIVPHGMHSGLMGGFAIATLAAGSDVLYAETAVRGITTSDPEDVTIAVERFEAIRSEALPMSMSIDLIQKAVVEKWT